MASPSVFGSINHITSQDFYNILGILGFILSASLTAYSLFKSRENYSISVIDYANRAKDVTQFLIIITNNSSNPLAISSIIYEGTDCELEPKKIRGQVGCWGFVSTPRFPVCISAHGCQYVYLEFVDVPYIPLSRGTAVTFQIQSTRTLADKIVILGDISHYLHSRE